MAAIKRRHQLFLAIELREAASTTGTYQTQTGRNLPIEPELEFDVAKYDRVSNTGRGLTRRQGLAGVRSGRARFGMELVATDGPTQFGNALRCSGFADETVGKFEIGAVSAGPFRHGERVNQASSGAFGTVVSDTWNGQTLLWVAQEFQLGDGTFDGTGALVGALSGATATPTTFTSAAGTAWWPYSFRTSVVQFAAPGLSDPVTTGHLIRGVSSRAVATVFNSQIAGETQVMVTREMGHFQGSEVVENLTTGDTNIGTLQPNGYEIQIRNTTASIGVVKDIMRERLQWARGNVKLAGTIGEPAIFSFEFLGSAHDTEDRAANLRPDTSIIMVPPVLLDVNLRIGAADDPQSALKQSCIRGFAIDMGNDVQLVECIALTQDHGPFFGPPHDVYTPRGVDMALIVSRNPTMTIDPLLGPEASFPWMDYFLNNRLMRLQMTIGSTAPNKFHVSMPGLSPSAAAPGDRNGMSTRNMTLELTAGPGRVQSDNEIVIVQEF
jgi:hypothetical protein